MIIIMDQIKRVHKSGDEDISQDWYNWQLKPFDPEMDNRQAYTERSEQVFTVNSIPDDKKLSYSINSN